MKAISLKPTLFFWQEIVFLIPLGMLLLEMSIKHAVVFRQSFDILCFCFFLTLFSCLIGQFFWRKKILAIFLSGLLGLSSVLLVFASLYAMTTGPQVVTSAAMLIFGCFLIVAAFLMPRKFASNKAII